MYTELCIGVRLNENVPKEVVDVLTHMAREGWFDKAPVPKHTDHPLFHTERWDWMLRSGGSYYFDAQPCLVWRYDDIGRCWFLTVWTNIKNYSGEWEAFLDWLAPHVDVDSGREYIGTYRYEESERPTLLFVNAGRIERE